MIAKKETSHHIMVLLYLNRKKIRWVYLVRFNSMNKTPFIKDSKSTFAIPYTANYSLL